MEKKGKATVIGITGGIGTGKSAVAEIIRNMGYEVLSSDSRAKEIMNTNKEVQQKLIKQFGKETFLDNGELNRKFLATLVFGDNPDADKNLLMLNSIVHPYVIDDLIEKVEELEEQGVKYIFSESALLYEAGLEEGYDYIIVVDAPEKLCVERVSKSRNIPEEEVRRRMQSQMHPEEKKKNADFVIDNKGTLEDLKNSVEFILALIIE